jgi:rRNA maturation protein Nop10
MLDLHQEIKEIANANGQCEYELYDFWSMMIKYTPKKRAELLGSVEYMMAHPSEFSVGDHYTDRRLSLELMALRLELLSGDED